jgi:hypothetical protein
VPQDLREREIVSCVPKECRRKDVSKVVRNDPALTVPKRYVAHQSRKPVSVKRAALCVEESVPGSTPFTSVGLWLVRKSSNRGTNGRGDDAIGLAVWLFLGILEPALPNSGAGIILQRYLQPKGLRFGS